MKIRIVKCLIDTEVTKKDQLYEEYFNNIGYFYPIRNDYVPNGIGLPFDVFEDSNWIKSGKCVVEKIIEAKETKWWSISNEVVDKEIDEISEQIKHLSDRLEYLKSI